MRLADQMGIHELNQNSDLNDFSLFLFFAPAVDHGPDGHVQRDVVPRRRDRLDVRDDEGNRLLAVRVPDHVHDGIRHQLNHHRHSQLCNIYFLITII